MEHFWKTRELSETHCKHKTNTSCATCVDLPSGAGNVLLYCVKKYWAHVGKLPLFMFSLFPTAFTKRFHLLPSMPLTRSFPTPREKRSSPASQQPNSPKQHPLEKEQRRPQESIRAASSPTWARVSTAVPLQGTQTQRLDVLWLKMNNNKKAMCDEIVLHCQKLRKSKQTQKNFIISLVQFLFKLKDGDYNVIFFS